MHTSQLIRSHIADSLKGIAVILMIQVHILELFAVNPILTSPLGKLLLFLGGPPVAPVFTIILGYFIAASKRSTKELIYRGLKVFGLGMLLNLALNMNLFISVIRGDFQLDLLPYVFGVDILQFAGTVIILLALIRKVFERYFVFLIVCILLSASLGELLEEIKPENTVLKYISALFFGNAKWSYFPLLPWLVYPLSGFAFFQLKKLANISMIQARFPSLIIGLVYVLFLLFSMRYAVSVSSDLPLYYHHHLLFCIWTLVFIAGYAFVLGKFEGLFPHHLFSRYIKWLGKNVTIIYIIQWIIIGNMATEIYKTVDSKMQLFLYFLGILVVTSTIVYMTTIIKDHFEKRKANKMNQTSL